MSNLKDIVKKTLLRLQKTGQIATPDAYKEAFCFEAKSAGLFLEDCQWQVRWMQKFDVKTKNQIQQLPIKTPDEFITLIAGILSRSNSGSEKESAQPYKELLKLFLHSHLFMQHFPELARQTLRKIDALDMRQYVNLKEQWGSAFRESQAQNEANSAFVKVLDPFLTPSISSYTPAEIVEIRTILKNTPHALFEQATESKLKDALSSRISADEREVAHKKEELEEIIEVLVAKLSSLMQSGQYYQEEVSHIGTTLKDFSPTAESLGESKIRLMELTQKIDKHVSALHNEINKKRSEIDSLSTQVKELTHELSKTKDEVNIDLLTGIHTRRYMEEALGHLEALFARYKSCYSVLFFDIDHFKNINDQYGHEAGDKILATFGKLLKQSVRAEDIVARYGGEEFIVLAPELDRLAAWHCAERIRLLVEESIFIYQDTRINISVSGGVAERSECTEQAMLLKLADTRLYKAKEHGRNQIHPRLGE